MVSKTLLAHDGVRIHYDCGGDPKGTPLILIHGVGSNHTTWHNTARRLKGVRWIALDSRGHGQSGGAPSVRKTVDDVLSIADAEGIKKFSVGGMCLGATIALDVARRAPTRVESVVVVSPFDKKIVMFSRAVMVLCQCVSSLCRIFPMRKNLRHVDFTQKPNLPFVLTPLWDLPGIHTRHYADCAVQTFRTPVSFRDIDVPVLVVTGNHDRLLKRSVLTSLMQEHGSVRHAQVDANHHILTWKPEQLSSIINTFMKV